MAQALFSVVLLVLIGWGLYRLEQVMTEVELLARRLTALEKDLRG